MLRDGKKNLEKLQGGVYALGNFDGVHRGHRAVIQSTVNKAHALHIPARALTFEPHPRMVFQPHQPPFLLTPLDVKEKLLKSCGVDDVVVLDFTHDFSLQTAQEFVEHILWDTLKVQHVVAGHDFVFGHKRGGDMKKLASWLAPHKIGVSEIASMGDEGETFSSTRVRELLLQGEVETAAEILGRNWSLTGTIIKGAERGRKIGIPTANVSLNDYQRPKFGVYAVKAGRVGEALSYAGVANIGVRPTVGGQSENLEAYLFDFNEDIYGQEWEFALTRFIRPEQKFDNLNDLKAQIAKDIEAAQDLLLPSQKRF